MVRGGFVYPTTRKERKKYRYFPHESERNALSPVTSGLEKNRLVIVYTPVDSGNGEHRARDKHGMAHEREVLSNFPTLTSS